MSFLPAGVRYLAASTCAAIYLPIHPSTLPGLFLPGLPFFGRWPNLASAARLLQPPIRYLLQPPRAPFPIHCVPPSPESLLADGRRSFATVLRLLRSFGLPGNRLYCLHATDSWGRLRSALPAHSRLGDQSIISPPPSDLLLARERHPHLPTEISPLSNLRARNYSTCLLEKHLRHT